MHEYTLLNQEKVERYDFLKVVIFVNQRYVRVYSFEPGKGGMVPFPKGIFFVSQIYVRV